MTLTNKYDLRKIEFYVPEDQLEQMKQAMFDTGARKVGELRLLRMADTQSGSVQTRGAGSNLMPARSC